SAVPQGALVAAYAIDDTLAQQIKQATTTDVVFFALDTLARPYLVGSTLPRDEVGPALAADTAALHRNARDSAGAEVPAIVGDEIGVLSAAFRGLVSDLKEKANLVEYLISTSGAASTAPLRVSRPSRQPGDALLPGTVFANRYEVKELLGMGGMGVVYRAFDRELQEPVAIKTLRPETLGGDGVALERFT